MKKILLVVLLCSTSVYADYNLQLMNNTSDDLYVHNECTGVEDGNGCLTNQHDVEFQPFKRNEIFKINYDKGMKSGKDYVLKSYFSFTRNQIKSNFISVTFHGDSIGSHVKSIDLFYDGNKYNLLNSNKGKVSPDEVGGVNVTYLGKNYRVLASAQHDFNSSQGIDSIYLSVNKDFQIFDSDSKPNNLSIMTYNIQAFPEYMSVPLDLNKLTTRIDYLSNWLKNKNYDIVAFQEAWDRASRTKLKARLASEYPYSIDPIPENGHFLPLNSGILILSKYPIQQQSFLNYQDYQTLTDSDKLANKGAVYFKLNKLGRHYNFIVTHTQAQDTSEAIMVRQEEFGLIKKHIIENPKFSIDKSEPLILLGDLNTDLYNQSQFNYMVNTLDLNNTFIKNTLNHNPKYSYDSEINLMIKPGTDEQGVYDYIFSVNGYQQPYKVDYQMMPVRAVDFAPMYRKSSGINLYNRGNIEVSDHFMVQAKYYFAENPVQAKEMLTNKNSVIRIVPTINIK